MHEDRGERQDKLHCLERLTAWREERDKLHGLERGSVACLKQRLMLRKIGLDCDMQMKAW